MNWDHTPRTLDAELLEECGSHDRFRRRERVWIQERTSNDADDDDAESSAKYLRTVSHHSATGHGSEIGDNHGDRRGIRGEFELISEHGRVEILTAVAREVHPAHEKDQVDK